MIKEPLSEKYMQFITVKKIKELVSKKEKKWKETNVLDI